MQLLLIVFSFEVICIVFLTILLVMPTTMIYIGNIFFLKKDNINRRVPEFKASFFFIIKGVKNLMNCPVEPMIPVYLFIGGSFGLIKLVQILWKQWRVRRKERYDREDSTYDVELQHELQNRSIGFNGGSKFIDTAITIFLLIWFVCGNYWVSSFIILSYSQRQEYDTLVVLE